MGFGVFLKLEPFLIHCNYIERKKKRCIIPYFSLCDSQKKISLTGTKKKKVTNKAFITHCIMASRLVRISTKTLGSQIPFLFYKSNTDIALLESTRVTIGWIYIEEMIRGAHSLSWPIKEGLEAKQIPIMCLDY